MQISIKLDIPIWLRILQYIHNNPNSNMSSISKYLNVTYAYTTAVIHNLERQKYISIIKEGRTTIIQLTPKGSRLINSPTSMLEQLTISGVIQ